MGGSRGHRGGGVTWSPGRGVTGSFGGGEGGGAVGGWRKGPKMAAGLPRCIMGGAKAHGRLWASMGFLW